MCRLGDLFGILIGASVSGEVAFRSAVQKPSHMDLMSIMEQLALGLILIK
jgi:hypothetical protein